MKRFKLVISMLILTLLFTGCNAKDEETTKRHKDDTTKNHSNIFDIDASESETGFITDFSSEEDTTEEITEELTEMSDEDFVYNLRRPATYQFTSDLESTTIVVPLFNFEGKQVVVSYCNPELTNPYNTYASEIGWFRASVQTRYSVNRWSVKGDADTTFYMDKELITMEDSTFLDADLYEKITDNLYIFKSGNYEKEHIFYFYAICDKPYRENYYTKRANLKIILDTKDYASEAEMDEDAMRYFNMFNWYMLPDEFDYANAENMATGEVVDLTQYCLINELTIKQAAEEYGVHIDDITQLKTANDNAIKLYLNDDIHYTLDLDYINGTFSDYFKNNYEYLYSRDGFDISVNCFDTLLFTHGEMLVYELDMYYPKDKYTREEILDMFFENYIN